MLSNAALPSYAGWAGVVREGGGCVGIRGPEHLGSEDYAVRTAMVVERPGADMAPRRPHKVTEPAAPLPSGGDRSSRRRQWDPSAMASLITLRTGISHNESV